MAVSLSGSWAGLTSGEPTGALSIQTGSSRVLVVVITYEFGSTLVAGMTVTVGGQAPSYSYEHYYAAGDGVGAHVYLWDEAAIGAMSGSDISYSDSVVLNKVHWAYATYTGVDQTTPATQADADAVASSVDVTTTSSSGDRIVCAACTDADARDITAWDTLTQISKVNPAGQYTAGVAEGNGGDGTTTVTLDGFSSEVTANAVVLKNAAGASVSINSVNGGSDITPGNRFSADGSGLTSVNSVKLGGQSMASISAATASVSFTVPTHTNLVIIYGNQVLVATDGGTTASASTILAPNSGYSYVDVNDLPWSTSAVSVFDGASPAVTSGDQARYESVTDKNFAVTLSSAGVPTIDGGNTVQKFNVSIYDATDTSWSQDFEFTVSPWDYVSASAVASTFGIPNPALNESAQAVVLAGVVSQASVPSPSFTYGVTVTPSVAISAPSIGAVGLALPTQVGDDDVLVEAQVTMRDALQGGATVPDELGNRAFVPGDLEAVVNFYGY